MKLGFNQNRTSSSIINRRIDGSFGEKIGIVGKIFGCWHKEVSRPFTHQKVSYSVCLHCGARQPFDAENLKTFGPFYYPPTKPLELK